jgi:hypothetical protein
MSRWKAAGIHLCISLVIAGISSALLIGVWYPPPYFHAGGAGKLLALVVGVDISIGPLLTLLVFKAGKRGLKFDLTVIGLLQAAALAYGFHTITSSRPVFMVAAVDRFVLVDADQIASADLAEASQPLWRSLSWTGPVLVAAELPKDPHARDALLFGSLQKGKDVQDYPQYYVPYGRAVSGLLKRAHSIAELRELNPGRGATINRWLASKHLTENQVVWLPIQPRKGDLVMMMDATTGKPLGALPLIAWASDRSDAAPSNHAPSTSAPRQRADAQVSSAAPMQGSRLPCVPMPIDHRPCN